MTTTEIKARIDAYIAGTSFSLPASGNTLNSVVINQWITTYFSTAITGTLVGSGGISGNKVIYTVAVPASKFSLLQASATTIEFSFYEVNGILHCAAKTAILPNYKFSNSFSILAGSNNTRIDQVVLSNSRLTITSESINNIQYDGRIEPSPFFSKISWLLGTGAVISGIIQTEVHNAITYPVLTVTGELGVYDGFSGYLLGLHIRLKTTLLATIIEGEGTFYDLNDEVALITSFTTPTLSVPVIMPLYGAGQYLVSLLYDSERGQTALTDINQLSGFTGNSSVSEYFNSELDLGSAQLVLKNAGAVLDPVNRYLTSFSFEIGMNLNWTIIPNVLALKNIDARVLIIDPVSNGNSQTSLSLDAVIEIAGVPLDVTVELPEKSIEARLPEGNTIGLYDVVEHFVGGINLPGDDDLDVYFLELYAKAETSGTSFSLTAEAGGEISLLTSLKLTDIFLALEFENGSFNEIRLSGQFAMNLGSSDEIDFYLSANHAVNDGWLFEGGTFTRQTIPIGHLFSWIANTLSIVSEPLPAVLNDLTIQNIQFSFNSATKDFSFSFDTLIPAGGKEIKATICASFISSEATYTRTFSGTLYIGDLQFELILNQTESASTSVTSFLASYQNAAGKNKSIRSLAEVVTSDTSILNALNNFSFQLKDALLIIEKGASAKIVFGLDIKGGLNLSNIPLLGKELPEGTSLRMTLQPVVSNSNFAEAELNHLRPLVPDGGFVLPKVIKQGVNLQVQLFIGNEPVNLLLANLFAGSQPEVNAPSVSIPPIPGSPSQPPPASSPSSTANVSWYPIQKTLGPVYFGRVGVQYMANRIFFLLDASISAANLTLTLDGLYVSSALNPLSPEFGLHGLGLDYKKGEVEIGGALLRNTILQNGTAVDTYEGTAIIKTASFTLSALGAYSYFNGHPSLFVYAFTNTALGGPGFFRVTGLAAGFGYNRRLLLPEAENVQDFPLVQEALNASPGSGNDLTAVLSRLHESIPPQTGAWFIAAGLRFTTFELINSFALLTVSSASDLEFDVVGLSTLSLPKEASAPLALVKMGFRAVYNPSKGYFKARAALTADSYVFSRKCHLTGGFAFYTWFNSNEAGSHAGDFVLSLGGYHPKFDKPANYPSVAPLGFNWSLSKHITIKGDMYFAMTPGVVMAGGHLQATWESGSIKAWFNAGADFLISWQPYHYEAEISVSVGVSYTYHFFGKHHITASVGADLSIWGPEFSGRAHVYLWIVSFTITFGADASRTPDPLNWAQFKAGFLPQDITQWNSISSAKGVLKEITDAAGKLTIVDPEQIVLQTQTVVPVTNATKGTASSSAIDLQGSNTNINIGAMKITDRITSNHGITVFKGSAEVTNQFTITPVTQNVPAALWGRTFTHSKNEINDNRFIENACIGFKIQGAPPLASGISHSVSRELIMNENEFLIHNEPGLNQPIVPNTNFNLLNADSWVDQTTITEVKNTLEQVADSRNQLLNALGFVTNYFPNKDFTDELLLAAVTE